MKVSSATVNLIKLHEGLYSGSPNKLVAVKSGLVYPYKDPVGIPTIGYGNTKYKDGTPVTLKDKPISISQAEDLFKDILEAKAKHLEILLQRNVNPYQFGALLSFAYNVGFGNLQKSTLLKKVNQNPNDESIEDEFNKYVFAKGQKLNGLVKRRNAEAEFYKKKNNLINQIMDKIKNFFQNYKKPILIFLGVTLLVVLVKKLTNGKK